MSKIDSSRNITSNSTGQNSSKKNNAKISYQSLAIKSSDNKVVKKRKLASSSRKIKTNLKIPEKHLKNYINSRVKRANDKLDNNLVKATQAGDYDYWLSQEDIADIARLKYQRFQTLVNYDNHFEIIGSFTQLKNIVKQFKERVSNRIASNSATMGTVLTLIIHQSPNHWATLVIYKELNHITGVYLDSKNQGIPNEYQVFFSKNDIGLVDLTRHFTQQQDSCNCGLWALENAADINLMLHKHQDILWAAHEISKPRDKNYFNMLRRELTEILVSDLDWRNRHPNYEEGSTPEQSSSSSDPSSRTSPEEEPAFKRAKFEDRKDIFISALITAFSQRLAACHLIAREGRISTEALRIELLTGMTGALLGGAFSQCVVGNCMGAVPSLVASTRALSGKLLIKKKSAQRITKCFDGVENGRLGFYLSNAALNIFYVYEYQFTHITDKAGLRVAMEKLADDAVDRIMNYIKQQNPNGIYISSELLEKGVLQGRSESFFDPKLKLFQLNSKGKNLINSQFETIESEESISSSKLFENVGLVAIKTQENSNKFYLSKKYPEKYGFRRLFDWEKDDEGDLKPSLQAKYSEYFPRNFDYQYALTPEMCQAEVKKIEVKLENKAPSAVMSDPVKKEETKHSILFNLRDPIPDFTGREEALNNLHAILTKNLDMAVISPSLLAAVSTANADRRSSAPSTASTSLQLSISGLGGIGKTQLALQYAKLYKEDFDNNIVWINAETLEGLDSSFIDLARKLQLETKDRYGLDKRIDEIVDSIYHYFSDKKALFIFDNAENFRQIENYLPKSLLGNKPTVLITSRFTHWKNVATVLSLDVFSEKETLALFKKVLGEEQQQYHILTLNKMLQGLPLALNQALAYIQFQRETDPGFSINQYIELFKTKSQSLLMFNLEYNNDPYLKTVFTTWLVTLDKINSIPELGAMAIEILDYTIYLDPENIAPDNFYALKDINNIDGKWILMDFVEYTDHIKQAMFLLKSYSLLNTGIEGHYVMHRLVQQVHRINVETDVAKFAKIIRNTQLLFLRQTNEKEDSHYLHFLLYMSEYEYSEAFLTHDSIKRLFSKLEKKEIKYWFYFLDLAYHKFPRARYLEFLADSLAYCRKEGFISLVGEMLNYFEDQYEIANFSLEDIVDMFSRIEYSRNYEIIRFSNKPEKQRLQKESIALIVELKKKIFGSFHNYNACVSSSSSSAGLRKKRDVCSEEEQQAWLEKIDYQTSKSYSEKVGQVASYINSGLITKDILGEICRGEWDEVAVNFGFILGTEVLGKVSNHMLIQGIKLESEAHLLIKELDLENPKIWSLLVNEEVAFIGKRVVLGKVLQIASTFVGSSTDLLAIYNLKKDIEAYQGGDKTVVPDIVGTSVISINGVVGVGLSASAMLGFVERSTLRLINPYLAAISALVWLGKSLYETEENIQAIQKYVNLSTKEHYVEFMRNFLNYQPSSYLQAKSNNEQLVLHALDFLKNNTDFRWYIAPIFSADNVMLNENNTALLDHKRTLLLSIVTPDEPEEGHLACVPGIPEENKSDSHLAYLCNGAFGLEYLLNRTAEVVLFNLGVGNDTAFGIPDFPNYFFVQNGKKQYMGGDEGNIFRFESTATTGRLTGGKKSDALLLEQFNPENASYLFIDPDTLLCGKVEALEEFTPEYCADDNSIELSQINQIYGRKNRQDVIYLNSAMQFVDGYAGYDTEHADIFFITKHSFQNPTIVLRNNTLVLFPIKNTVQAVDYQIPPKEAGQAEIRTNFAETLQHRFFFDASLDDILTMNVQNDTLTVSVFVEDDEDVSTFTIKLYDPHFIIEGQSHVKNVTNFEKCSSYFFENMELKLVNDEQIFAEEILANNKTLEQKIDRFSTLARHLEKTITIQLLNNETLAIGSRSHDYFSIDGSSVTHLAGNGGENVYLVIPKKPSTFPLENITLYANPSMQFDLNESIDTVDLSAMTDYIKRNCPQAVMSSELSREGADLILKLSSYMETGRCTEIDETWELATIRFKEGVYWYRKIDILLEHNLSQHISTQDGESWTLTGPTLFFKEHKNIINLMPNDIAENSEIFLSRNSGNYSFFRNESNLILSNVHTAPPLTACTVIAHNYYQDPIMQRRLLSSKLSFLDETFELKDNQEQINEAQHFSNFAKLLESENSFKNKHELRIPFLGEANHELPKLRRKRQIDNVADDEFSQASFLAIKLGVGVGLVLSSLLCLRLFNKLRNSPVETIPLQSIVITGLTSVKSIAAQLQTPIITETSLDLSNGFSIENNCLIAETPIGWLGACQNKPRVLFLKAQEPVFSKVYFESYQINGQYLEQVEEGIWRTNLFKITHNVLADEIYPLLPPSWQAQWQAQIKEKRIQQQIVSFWKQHAAMMVTSTLSDKLVLYTRLGDLFKTLGLAPDWQAREDRYLLNRCWFALEQHLFHPELLSHAVSLGSITAELALLHPATHESYKTLIKQGDISKAKFAVRFVADILQFGFYNLCHLAHVLEYCFPANALVKNMSLGLRMANYFYFLTGDLSYWHLGLALFLLPQLPQLLDHLGVPATRGMHVFCNKLAIYLLSQTLLQKLSADAERQAQADCELSDADVRVMQGRQRLSTFVTSSANFFLTNKSNNSCSANDEDKKTSRTLQFFY